jgi:hypothetical protein
MDILGLCVEHQDLVVFLTLVDGLELDDGLWGISGFLVWFVKVYGVSGGVAGTHCLSVSETPL